MASLRLNRSFRFSTFWSREFFLSRGLTTAVLKSGGTRPEASEVLMMLVGGTTSRFSYSNFVGMGSRSRDLENFFGEFSKQIVQ